MIAGMATLRLFASARETAGTTSVELDGDTVADVLEQAEARFGDDFVAVLAISRVWLNGEQVARDSPVVAKDEIAVLPPVSGG